jgi:hypothetical protein
MGYLIDGVRMLTDRSAFHALWHFDNDLRQSHGNMQVACDRFFERQGYELIVERPWHAPRGGILFFSDHHSALDGFAIARACPTDRVCRRVIFTLTALTLGRSVFRHSITVWPRGNWHNLIFETSGFVDRVAYLITHRWGPWVRPAQALERMCRCLHSGESLTILPSGTVGEDRWRAGLGAILLRLHSLGDGPEHDEQNEVHLAPTYVEWDHAVRKGTVQAPQLIPLSRLMRWAEAELGEDQAQDRKSLTQWIKSRYRARNWGLDV